MPASDPSQRIPGQNQPTKQTNIPNSSVDDAGNNGGIEVIRIFA